MAALLALSGSAVACPPEYDVEIVTIAPCGPLPSGAVGLDINDAGDVVGYAVICFGNDRAFLWPAGTSQIQLLTMPTGTTFSRATAINNSGQIVGEYGKPPNGTRGFMIDNGVFHDMGTLRGGNWSEAHDVNDAGVAVGFWGNTIQGPSPLAMQWQAGVMTSLARSLAHPYSDVNAINAAGVITGHVSKQNSDLDARAFLWNGKRLTVLPPVDGGYTSEGRAINSLGQVTGWGNSPCDPPQLNCVIRRGFFWDGLRMVSIEPLPGYPSVRPYGLNDAGTIVGYVESGNNHPAFLWHSGQIYTLDELAGFDGISATINLAYAINNSGQVTGHGGMSAGTGVVRLTPKPRRSADLDCDGAVGGGDIAVLIAAWGAQSSPADLDRSGAVDAADLGLLLGDWGD